MSKRFVLIGSTLSGNKGAAAMLESALQTLEQKFPGSSFTLLTYLPVQREEELNTYKNLTVLKASPLYLALVINPLAVLYRILPPLRSTLQKNKQIQAIVQADVLLDQGGITFVDGREKFLLYNIASILPALLVKTKVVKCAQALGPFHKLMNKSAARFFLPKVAHIVSRGAMTHQYLKELKLKNCTQGADYAFLLELTKKEADSAKQYYPESFFQNKKVVGISPSVVMKRHIEKSGKNYEKIMTTFCNHLIQNGYKVVLLPHSGRKDATKSSLLDKLPIVREIRATHSNDLSVCQEIFAGVHKKTQCLFIEHELSSQQLRAIIGRCQYFVASRFHAMISSLAMRVPTLVIGWSHKYKEVLEMFELEQWAFGQEKLSNTYLQQQFNELVKNESVVRQQLKQNLPDVKKVAKIQVEIIASIVS